MTFTGGFSDFASYSLAVSSLCSTHAPLLVLLPVLHVPEQLVGVLGQLLVLVGVDWNLRQIGCVVVHLGVLGL